MTPITETLRRLAEAKTDLLVHTLWEHYPEGLPPWSDVEPRIRSGIIKMAEKVVQALSDRDETICAAVDAAKRLRDAQERIRKPERRADLEDACNAANDARRDLDTALEALAKVEG